jgi:putative membrane protein
MRLALTAAFCLTLCALPALAQKSKPPMSDQQFLDTAAQTDMVEVHLGTLAQDAGSSQGVKDYGQMLARDHMKDYQALQALAQQAGLTLPTAIDDEHNKAMIGPMHTLKGAAFDHKYLQNMIAGHAQAIVLYKQEAHDATNPAIRSYAEHTLPTLKKHLDDAMSLERGKPSPMSM